jgi:cell division protein FtsB
MKRFTPWTKGKPMKDKYKRKREQLNDHEARLEWLETNHVALVKQVKRLEHHIPDGRKLIEPIEATVGMQVEARDEGGVVAGSGTISRIVGTSIFVASEKSDELEYRLVKGRWVSLLDGEHIGDRTITCAKTGRPVVLPSNNGEKLDTCADDEPEASNEEHEPDTPKIEVGSYWKRNSDGKLCVVTRYEVFDESRPSANTVEFRYEHTPDGTDNWDAECFSADHTYLYTCNTVEQLLERKDGDKLIDHETGEVVRVEAGVEGIVRLRDGAGMLRSINGLPHTVLIGDHMQWEKSGKTHREEGPALITDKGTEVFSLDGQPVPPEEWADRVLAMGKGDGVLPKWQHLIEAAKERAGCGEEYPLSFDDLFDGSRFSADTQFASDTTPKAKKGNYYTVNSNGHLIWHEGGQPYGPVAATRRMVNAKYRVVKEAAKERAGGHIPDDREEVDSAFDYKGNYERLCAELDEINPIIDDLSSKVLKLTAIASRARDHHALSVDHNNHDTIKECEANAAIEAAAAGEYHVVKEGE